MVDTNDAAFLPSRGTLSWNSGIAPRNVDRAVGALVNIMGNEIDRAVRKGSTHILHTQQPRREFPVEVDKYVKAKNPELVKRPLYKS